MEGVGFWSASNQLPNHRRFGLTTLTTAAYCGLTNGSTWIGVVDPDLGQGGLGNRSTEVRPLGFGGDYFLAGVSGGLKRSNGGTWGFVLGPQLSSSHLSGRIAFGGGDFFWASWASQPRYSLIHSSTNGDYWRKVGTITNVGILDIAVGDSSLVAVGFNAGLGVVPTSGAIFSSRDKGYSWSRSDYDGRVFISAAYGDSTFIAVGQHGTIARSTDGGAAWRSGPNLSRGVGLFRQVTFGGGIFVAVGQLGVIYYSEDSGQTWKAAKSGTHNTLTSVVYGNGSFLVTGDGGTMLQSATEQITKTEPFLAIQKVPGGALISWPESEGFEIESSLGFTEDWQLDTNATVNIGDQKVLSINPRDPKEFYRLTKAVPVTREHSLRGACENRRTGFYYFGGYC